MPILTAKTWVRHLVILISGAICSFAMQPFEFWPALLLGFSAYWLLLTSFDKKRHAWLGSFLFGLGYFVAGTWWIGNALLVDGNPFLWALPFASVGFQALLALFPMVFGALSQHFFPGRSLPSYLFFIVMMSFAEWTRGHWFTGFPWNLFGMTWTSSLAFAQMASYGGIYLLSLFTVFLAALPGFLWLGLLSKRGKTILAGLAIFISLVNYAWGYQRLQRHPTEYNKDVIVQVVTPNIPQGDKWNPDLTAANFYKTIRLMQPEAARSFGDRATGKSRVIVLPETALLPSVFQSPEAMKAIQSVLASYPEKTYLMSGALRHEYLEDGKKKYYNSLVAIDQAGATLTKFDKFHLVPFGEYMPYQKYIPVGPVVKFSGFERGTGPAIWSLPGLPDLSPLVCYEIIFAGRVKPPQTHPKWMVNVTNDAWYGISPGPYQHLAQTIFRAIEEGMPVIRSTNTGISAVIDSMGRVVSASPLFEDYVQTLNLPEPVTGNIYSRYPDLIYFSAIILLLAVAILKRNFRII